MNIKISLRLFLHKQHLMFLVERCFFLIRFLLLHSIRIMRLKKTKNRQRLMEQRKV